MSHLIVSCNVGGSRDALNMIMGLSCQVLLVQEHRVDGAGLPGLQALAASKGWHGVWDQADSKAKHGRSGGTAVLVRMPIQVSRTKTLRRATVACIAWTRTTRLHVASVYGPDSQRRDRVEEGKQLWGELQSYLAEVGSVPWVMGGDWNMEPEEFHSVWNRPAAQVDGDAPTQKHGGNFDWFLHAPKVKTRRDMNIVVPGADHVAVAIKLMGDQAATMGKRLVQPQAVDKEG
jgi:exonuclease III